MRLHRPIGIWLLLWPTLWALWIAGEGKPDLKILIIFMIGTIIMRSAGCVINDIADRHFDGYVARTRQRPLVTGAVTLKQAIILFLILCVMALVLVLQLNRFTIQLSIIGLLLAILYPFTKRITYWPQLVLGMAFAWSVPMAFAAQTNTVPGVGWFIYSIAVLWPLAYDTMYALDDREDDRKIGVKSTAILFANYNQLIIGILQIIILSLLTIMGLRLNLASYYYISLIIAAGLASYQQYLLKNQTPPYGLKAFLNNHWFGAVIFVGIYLSF
jgi:4-hydroxybenzoate polyprenyltransferase